MFETELNLSVRSSSVSIVTRPWAVSSGVGISLGKRDFSFSRNVQDSSAFFSMGV